MRTLLRCLREYSDMWRIWLPMLVLVALTPLVGVGMPLVERQLIDGVVGARPLYVALWLLSTIFLLFGTTLRTYLDERVTMRLRQALFARSQALSVAFAKQEHSGRTMSLFVNDVPSMAGVFSTTTTGLVGSLVTLVIGIVVMFSLSWQLAIAAGVLPPLVAGAAWVMTGPLRPAARRAQEKAAELTQRLQENLAGMREVVAFARERSQGLRFTTTLRELLRLRMRVTLMDTAIQTGQLLFSLSVTLVILGYGGYLVIQGHTTLGTVIAMRSLFGMVWQPAGQLGGIISSIQKSLGAADRVYAFLDETPRVRDNPGARMPDRIEGAVAFEHVSFGYRPEQIVLRDISLAAHPGEVVALVGPSGAGKSTLASLIARFYDPTEGRVLLDGTDLRDLPLEGLRGPIGMVFQDSFLFAGTIRENILFGRESATEGEVIAAARAANAWEFVDQLPAGLDTPVGERGVQLSEGQKQRLAIARALLRNPRILILDEPTSALDARAEHLLQTALENLMRGRTTFVIAHRLATVQRADRIVVLDAGCIVEQGTHAELLGRKGLYRELYDLQFAPPPGLDIRRLPASTSPALAPSGLPMSAGQ
jgi:subfamily B ATP-binding cassette protein MsbA